MDQKSWTDIRTDRQTNRQTDRQTFMISLKMHPKEVQRPSGHEINDFLEARQTDTPKTIQYPQYSGL